MNLLALETSTHTLSAALLSGNDVLQRSDTLPNGGSQHLLPWVHALLDEAGLKLTQLDGIAFGAGPGAFTGLRLACGVTQGLAWGADIPVVGICTLEAMAFNADAERVFACLDARMNEVYAAAYVKEGEALFRCEFGPVVQAPESLAAPEGVWKAVGDGFAAYAQTLQAKFPHADTVIVPTAEAVARLALPRFIRGEGQPALAAAPLYVRDKVALTTAERLARGRRQMTEDYAEMSPAMLDDVLAIEQEVQSHPWTRGNFEDSLRGGHRTLVMRADGCMVGFAVVMPLPDEAELLNIAISRAHQGRGLGRKLLEKICEDAHRNGAGRMHLEVRRSNEAARRLYRRSGFDEVGMRRDYYAAGEGGREDAILMAKEL